MLRFIAFSILVLLAACGVNTQNGSIQTEYAETVVSLGLAPVYPPSEDIQVGDIYAVSLPKTETANSLQENPFDSVRLYLGHDPRVLREAERHLRSRIVFRSTVIESNEVDAEQTDLFRSGRLDTRNGLTIETLPIVGFPTVTADAGVSGSIGIANLLSSLGLSAGTRTQVTLNFNDVRRYGFPPGRGLPVASAAVFDLRNEPNATPEAVVEALLAQQLLFSRARNDVARAQDRRPVEEDMTRRCTKYRVVTQVYLTRKISYTFSNASITALALEKLKTSDGTTAAATLSQGAQAPAPVIVNVNPPSDGAPIAIDQSQLGALREAVAAPRSTQGQGLQFETFTALGAEFSQTFRRPVVIAWEGYDVNLEPDACILNR